ncbi:hypothetical protein PVAR5_5685 [Paecilomyces variotii No. 5]|uniref:GAF domain-containing protein n=1 Tax=Byssochlamys spectabilis (strain No. 5 / NBRC 109023) TaxID=1356009 RepID=V5G817_BYSSN|nr:hypothetical protein PVAR5_5685 [Paecilomyces variotii No. 5]
MPHADASQFPSGLSKDDLYKELLSQTKGLLEGQRNWISNFANVASLLWHAYAALPAPSNKVNWTGFYVRDDKFPSLAAPVSSSPGATVTTTISTTYATSERQVLLLGPFHGKPACQQILFGKGVCGVAAETKETQVVPDVEAFPGHIACDSASKSEIVVPILTVALIDIDCTEPAAFDEVDKKYLEDLASFLAEACDW